ncbi:MAG: aminotransferase class I/II-fold pyridoxal phosphate-dependent enzyme [Planctomycetota bacterium]
MPLDLERLLTDRSRAIDASGIRRAFDLAAKLDAPINLSIGQPHFDVPAPVRDAAQAAIDSGRNGYTPTQGSAPLLQAVGKRLAQEFPATYGQEAGETPGPLGLPQDTGVLATSGVSGALVLALLACAQPGDEVVMPDPGFVMYRHLTALAGATPVPVDTYPDFRLTAERVEAVLTPKTKMVILNSPGNPTGVVATAQDCRELYDLCQQRGVLLVTDEIYDAFCYEPFASPAAVGRNLLLLRGFSKTYGMTGWRLGYAVGPKPLIEQMAKFQQYTFVCAPSMTQAAGVAALDVDMSAEIDAYRRKRDRVVERLSGHYQLTPPGGAFYAFPEVPENLGMTGSQFIEHAITSKKLIVIPGSVFSQRDTHLRISFAADDDTLDAGLDALVELASE